MNSQKCKAIMKQQQLNRHYLRLSRDGLINELALTEQIFSSGETSEELKFLYKKRYMKILEILKEKLENFKLSNLNILERV